MSPEYVRHKAGKAFLALLEAKPAATVHSQAKQRSQLDAGGQVRTGVDRQATLQPAPNHCQLKLYKLEQKQRPTGQ